MPQSLAQLWTHIIFSTKNRYPYLQDKDIRQLMHHKIADICGHKKCHVQIVGGVADHVHLLVNLHKNTCLANFIEEIKTTTSRWIKTVDRSNFILTKFYWQKGYGAFSVSQSAVNNVASYIPLQQSHHQKYSFQDEVRRFLQKYGIKYDERYLWD